MRAINSQSHNPVQSHLTGGGRNGPIESVASYRGVERRSTDNLEHARNLRVLKSAQIVLDKLLEAWPNGCTAWINRSDAPDRGYVVGVKGHETKWDYADIDWNTVYSDCVDKIDYVDRCLAGSISDPPVSVGLWVCDGEVYCDIGIVHDDRIDALRWGYENGQDAIWDLAEDTSIYL
jgi:hypothetical protein